MVAHTFTALDPTATLTFSKTNVGTPLEAVDTNPIISGIILRDVTPGVAPLVTGPGTALVSNFTGADPGEGLDLQGDFVYAINFGTPGAPPTLIGDGDLHPA